MCVCVCVCFCLYVCVRVCMCLFSSAVLVPVINHVLQKRILTLAQTANTEHGLDHDPSLQLAVWSVSVSPSACIDDRDYHVGWDVVAIHTVALLKKRQKM